MELRTHLDHGRTGLPWPVTIENGYAEAREGVHDKAACERSTELAPQVCNWMTKSDVPELA